MNKAYYSQNEIVEKVLFDANRLNNYVETFSFPRLAGTDGEKRSVELTMETFKKIGFTDKQIKERNFKFSDFYSTTLIKLIMILNLTFNLVLILFAYINILLSIFHIVLMVLIVSFIIKGLKHPETPGFWGEYFGETFTATNVFTKIPAKQRDEEEAGNIILSAHLDSKSQTINTYWRVFFYRVWIYGGIGLGIFYILYLIIIITNLEFDFRLTLYGAWVTVILISLSNIFLMFLDTHNKSPGALDNASGMAVVFELSSHLIKNPLKNFNIWICQFSAEELGTMGSRIFVNEHESKFMYGRTFQFNFDMVSCKSHKKNRLEYFRSYGTIIRKKCAPLLSKYVELAAKKERVEIQGLHLSSGAHTDTVPFHLRKLDAIDISTKAAALYTHTKNDTPEKVDPKVLADSCKVIYNAILMIDEDFEDLCKNNNLVCEVK